GVAPAAEGWVPSARFRVPSPEATPTRPTPPLPRGPTGLHRTQFRKRKIKHFFSSFLSKQIFPRASREQQQDSKLLQSRNNPQLSRCTPSEDHRKPSHIITSCGSNSRQASQR